MADTTGIRNVVISLDLENSQIKLMKILGNSIEDSVIEFLPINKRDFVSTNYGQMLVMGLKPYIERSDMRYVNYHLVLPDELFAMWKLSIPSIAKIKIEDALKVEILKDIEDENLFQYKTSLVSNDNNTAIFFAEAINNELLNDIKGKLSEIGVVPKDIVSRSVSVVNSILALRVRAREGTYALVDIRKGSTTMAYVNKARYFGNINLNFGYEILRTDRLVDEELLFNHDSASIVIAHSMETTTSIGNEEGDDLLLFDNVPTEENDEQNLSEQEIKEKEEATKRFEEAAEYAKSLDAEIIKRMENEHETNENIDDNASDDEMKPQDNLEDTKDKLSITNKLYETRDDFNITNKLYETRPTAELYQLSSTFDLHVTNRLNTTDMFTTSGITLRDNVLQNFRIFMKQINLFVEYYNSGKEDLPKLDYILVNIPKRYSFLLTKANAERGNSIEYKYFNPTVEDKPLFTENLDLYGILSLKSYNTNHAFE